MKRQTIYIEEFGHKHPIPAAARIGNWVATGIVYGLDPATGKPADTLERQCELMFRHLLSVLKAAGCGPEHILKLNVTMVDRSQRGPLNKEWEALYPDRNDRPARQTMEGELDGGKLIQCDCIAIADGPGA